MLYCVLFCIVLCYCSELNLIVESNCVVLHDVDDNVILEVIICYVDDLMGMQINLREAKSK